MLSFFRLCSLLHVFVKYHFGLHFWACILQQINDTASKFYILVHVAIQHLSKFYIGVAFDKLHNFGMWVYIYTLLVYEWVYIVLLRGLQNKVFRLFLYVLCYLQQYLYTPYMLGNNNKIQDMCPSKNENQSKKDLTWF